MQAIRSYIALICPAQHTAKTPPYTYTYTCPSVRPPAYTYIIIIIININSVIYIEGGTLSYDFSAQIPAQRKFSPVLCAAPSLSRISC